MRYDCFVASCIMIVKTRWYNLVQVVYRCDSTGWSCVVLSDSMLKYQSELNNCYLQASKGATVERFYRYIVSRKPDKKPRWTVEGFKVVLVHVGSNNLYLLKPDEYGCYMEQLVQRILLLSPGCKVVLTSLLPRPVDSPNTRPVARGYNFELMRLADPRVGPRFAKTTILPGVNTYYVNLANCVIDSNGKVISCMFTKNDSLHLSRQGNTTMKFKLRSILNNFRYGLTSKYLGRLPIKMVHYYQKMDAKCDGW